MVESDGFVTKRASALLKAIDPIADSEGMRSTIVLVLTSLVVTACASTADVDPTVPAGVTAGTTETTTPSATQPPTTASETTTSGTVIPEYDVFLAAVATALEGTRYENEPFDNPEVVASTGLLFCERIKAGDSPDEVVLEYLTDLTGGDATAADDDQLALAGAILGAATEALCPQPEEE